MEFPAVDEMNKYSSSRAKYFVALIDEVSGFMRAGRLKI